MVMRAEDDAVGGFGGGDDDDGWVDGLSGGKVEDGDDGGVDVVVVGSGHWFGLLMMGEKPSKLEASSTQRDERPSSTKKQEWLVQSVQAIFITHPLKKHLKTQLKINQNNKI